MVTCKFILTLSAMFRYLICLSALKIPLKNLRPMTLEFEILKAYLVASRRLLFSGSCTAQTTDI